MTKHEKQQIFIVAMITVLAVAALLGLASDRRMVMKQAIRESTDEIGEIDQNQDGIFVNCGAKVTVPETWLFAEQSGSTYPAPDSGNNIVVECAHTAQNGVAYNQQIYYKPLEYLVYSPSGNVLADDAVFYSVICAGSANIRQKLEEMTYSGYANKKDFTCAKELVLKLGRRARNTTYCVARCDFGSAGQSDYLVLEEFRPESDDFSKKGYSTYATAVTTEMTVEHTFVFAKDWPTPAPESVYAVINGQKTVNDEKIDVPS